ncbi:MULTISPECIES: ABC transporter permease [unclassified Aminobacter]|uniref:ABC transporter permease n=3 Tax=Aminobacter TaxID=31988 RepID=UPI00163C5C4A|nr:ABC transporter permease [Aminobacter sp. MDW-2]QNH35597.1 ABC transporter permease [Aminobacter sp. MDW-2]
MNWWEGFRIARRALWVNRLRSFLTMLGIVVGVASVIAMVALGSGAKAQVEEQIRSFGANVLVIEPIAGQSGGGARLGTLTEPDARGIAGLPPVRAAAPSVRGHAQIVRGNRNWSTTVNGTTVDYFVVRDWPLSAGRQFSSKEESSADKVVLIGHTVAQELFQGGNPIGAEVRILNAPFQVIGVLAAKGQSGAGTNQDDVVFVPISTAKRRLFGGGDDGDRQSVAYILAKIVSEEKVGPAVAQIQALLRQHHRLGSDRDSDFIVINPAEAMALRNATTTTFAWLLASIASVSLLVGGISIMNIMLVSVTERTREVGIRLAMGARRKDIRTQFLMEAITLCLLGGLIGLVLGAGIAIAAGRLAGWPIFIGLNAPVLAIVFSASVGLFFGWYPASRAARLEPVEALRHE